MSNISLTRMFSLALHLLCMQHDGETRVVQEARYVDRFGHIQNLRTSGANSLI